MELNKLYYFYVVAKHEHVTRAAEELCISQPALTKTIKLLEEEMGVPLFRKEKRNIKLTQFGKLLKEKLDGVFQILGEIPTDIKLLQETEKSIIRLNVLAASTIVTEAIVNYKKKNEKAVFQVIQNEEEQDCDISVLTNSVEFVKEPAFEKQYSLVENIYLAVPENHCRCEGKVKLSDFRDEGFVNLAGSRVFRAICDRFCASVGFSPKIIFESDSIIAVKNLIGAGAGVGFWPAFSWGDASEDIKLLPVIEPECKRKIVVGLHKNLSQSLIAEDFFEYLVSFMEEKAIANQIEGIK